jgi:hypothetical protein
MAKTVRLSKKKSHQIYRLKDGTVVPGGSTISKVGEDQGFLINWAWNQGREGLDYKKTTDEAANIGSVAHFLITCYFNGDTPDFSEFSKVEIDKGQMVFDKFLETWNESGMEFVANEVQLVSEKYRYGGTLDLIGRHPTKGLTLVDEKSSPSIYGHFYRQVASYKELWNENNPDDPIERAMIFRHGKKSVEDIEVRQLPRDMSAHFEVFKAQLALYYAFKNVQRS